MKKYKLLRFGHCYINASGDLVIGLLHGNKKRGYTFAASSAHPAMFLQNLWIPSRIVPNDGHWTEVSSSEFNVVSMYHAAGYKANPTPKGGICVAKF